MRATESVHPITPLADGVGQGGSPESEAETAKRASEGDARAFEALYRNGVGRVYALCRRMTGDPETARELTQVAFIRAWEWLPTFRGESAFSSWMHRLAVNVVLAHFRANRSRPEQTELPENDEAVTAQHESSIETRLDFETALAQLPEKARIVFVLHDVEGFRHEEIAAMLDVHVGTSKSQLHRARRLLKEVLT